MRAHIKLQKTKRELARAHAYQKKYADKADRQLEHQAGSQVRLKAANLPDGRSPEALGERYEGLLIEKMVGPNAARLQLPPSVLIHPVFHVLLLRPLEQEPDDLRRGPKTQQPVGQGEYVVEAILGHKKTRQGRKYLLRWLVGSTTWDPEGNLRNARDLGRRYHRGCKAQVRQGRNPS